MAPSHPERIRMDQVRLHLCLVCREVMKLRNVT